MRYPRLSCPVPCTCDPAWTYASGIDWYWEHAFSCPHTGLRQIGACTCPPGDLP